MRLPVLGLGPSHARRRRAPALLAAAALAEAVTGCGSQAAGGSSDPDPASAVPATAPLYLEAVVQPDGDVRGEVDAVAGKLLATGDPRGRLVQLLDRGLRKHDVNASYARDVEPWLGKRVGVAVTGHRGDRADVLLSAAVKDEDAAEQALDRIAQGDEVREYAGQRYRFSVKDKAATALLGDTLVAGTEPAVKAAVDARKGDALADSDRYAKAHDLAADDDAVGFFYLQPARALDLVAQSGRVPSAQLGLLGSALTGGGAEAYAGALHVSGDALRLDAVSIGGENPPPAGDAAAALAAAPAGAWLAVGIGDVNATLRTALDRIATAGGIGGIDPQTLLDQLKASAGFDVQRELLSWMGDATLFVRGATVAGLDGALVVHSEDPAASTAAIGRLRTLLATIGVTPTALPAGSGAEAGFEVAVPGHAGLSVSVAVKGDRFVIAYGADALAAALAPGARLGDTGAFADAKSTLDGAEPTFFLDVPAVVGLLEGPAGNDPRFAKLKPTLDALGPMAAGTSRDGGTPRLQVGVKVK